MKCIYKGKLNWLSNLASLYTRHTGVKLFLKGHFYLKIYLSFTLLGVLSMFVLFFNEGLNNNSYLALHPQPTRFIFMSRYVKSVALKMIKDVWPALSDDTPEQSTKQRISRLPGAQPSLNWDIKPNKAKDSTNSSVHMNATHTAKHKKKQSLLS